MVQESRPDAQARGLCHRDSLIAQLNAEPVLSLLPAARVNTLLPTDVGEAALASIPSPAAVPHALRGTTEDEKPIFIRVERHSLSPLPLP